MRPDQERTRVSGQPVRRGRSALEIVPEFAKIEVAAHPFFTDLRTGPLDMQAIWILMANLRAGISRDFVIWLATTIARVDDRRIALVSATGSTQTSAAPERQAKYARAVPHRWGCKATPRPRRTSDPPARRTGQLRHRGQWHNQPSCTRLPPTPDRAKGDDGGLSRLGPGDE